MNNLIIGKSFIRDRVERFIRKHEEYVLNFHPRYARLQGKKNTLRLYYNGVVRISNKVEFKFSEMAVKKHL